jgi:hypothetical protein
VPTLEDIGLAIGTAAETLEGMRSQQEWGDTPNVSGSARVAVVEYDGTTYDSAFDGQASEVMFKVTVLAAGAERAARGKLLALCDPGSATAFAAAVTGNLGGLVSFCRVVSNTGLRDIRIGIGEESASFPGIEFVLAVMPS